MIADQFILDKKSTKEQYGIDRKSERPLRSIAKSISWRLIGTLDTILISWIITGKVKVALSIGLVELFTKMLLYFFHERIWNQIGWGK
jgi:uncharacterized membrane protein